MTTTEITAINVWSLAGMCAIIMWGLALLLGWPVIFLEQTFAGAGYVLYGIIVVSSIAVGLLVGVVVSVIYNFMAHVFGGLVIELEAK